MLDLLDMFQELIRLVDPSGFVRLQQGRIHLSGVPDAPPGSSRRVARRVEHVDDPALDRPTSQRHQIPGEPGGERGNLPGQNQRMARVPRYEGVEQCPDLSRDSVAARARR